MKKENKLNEANLNKGQLSSLSWCKPERLSILVVEDSISARMKIVSCLEMLDVNIYETDDGTSAFAILMEKKQTIDLVLTDLNMKIMDGDELCYKIRNELQRPDLPVIVLSSSIDKKTTVNLFSMGATDYLYKPFTAEELVARINTHLERLRLNDILIKQIKQLNDLNQMKDDLLAVCSHDFRSPLQVILGYTELLMGDTAAKDHQKNMLASIRTSGENLLEMINEILVIGKGEKELEKIEMTVLPVRNIIRSCITNFYSIAAKKNISLSFIDIDVNPFINGNQNSLTRIFNNLLSNAIKFTPSGGSVTIGLEIDEDKILQISISDTGIGIPENKIHLLFDRYSDASRKGTNGEKNTGLGLFITKELIDAHNAAIEITSKVDEGSCFIIKFPLVDNIYVSVVQKLLNTENP